jgi:hypothetical protein
VQEQATGQRAMRGVGAAVASIKVDLDALWS